MKKIFISILIVFTSCRTQHYISLREYTDAERYPYYPESIISLENQVNPTMADSLFASKKNITHYNIFYTPLYDSKEKSGKIKFFLGYEKDSIWYSADADNNNSFENDIIYSTDTASVSLDYNKLLSKFSLVHVSNIKNEINYSQQIFTKTISIFPCLVSKKKSQYAIRIKYFGGKYGITKRDTFYVASRTGDGVYSKPAIINYTHNKNEPGRRGYIRTPGEMIINNGKGLKFDSLTHNNQRLYISRFKAPTFSQELQNYSFINIVDSSNSNFRNLLRNRSYLLIDFWGSWCNPCIAGLPTLHESQNLMLSKGVAIAGILVDKEENIKKALAILDSNKITTPQHWIEMNSFSNSIFRKNGISAFPTYLLFDKNLILLKKAIGLEGLKEMISYIKQL